MRRAKQVKLNAHTDASGNLCAFSRIQVTSRNGWHEISGANACRCRGCWPEPVYGSQMWFLRLENFLVNALHIDGGRRERISRLHKWRIT